MRPEELRELGDLAGDVAGGVTRRIRDTHRAVAHRVFDFVGPAALPVQVVHDGIAGLVYGTVAIAGRQGLRAAGAATRAALPPGAEPLQAGPSGRRAVALLNGAAGDLLHERRSPLEVRMTVRVDGRSVPPEPRSLARAYPDATHKLAVFVPGLGQTEGAWRRSSEIPLYGQRLRSELGITPLYVRYNTGRAVAENGADLARLLSALIDAWPVAVQELSLVGHALGALVCRSAAEAAAEESWVERLRHVITLGAPHRGTTIERLLRTAGGALNRLPETRPAGRTLELRSAGMKDSGRGSQTPFLPHVRYLFVSGSISADPDGGLGRLLGDLVVSRDSAWAHPGGRAPVQFPVDSYRHIGGVSHFGLTSHPIVAEQLVQWLSGGRRLTAGPRLLPPAGGTGAGATTDAASS
jgi:hypothetical protein